MADGRVIIDVLLDTAKAVRDADKLPNKFKSVGGKMAKVGAGMTAAITLPVVAFGKSVIDVGMQFDDTMAEVRAVTGATGDDFKKLEDKARELGATTAFSASQAAEGMVELGRAGFDTNEIIDMSGDVLNFASANSIELSEAADIAGNMLATFGKEAGETENVVDILSYTAANSATNVTEVGEAMKYVGPIADELGISMEETSAMIGILADNNIRGGQAGRHLRKGLQELSTMSDSTKKQMKDLGVEVYDTTTGKMKPATQIVGELEQATKGMSDEQKMNTMEMLFGKEAMGSWMTIIGEGGDKLGEFTKDIEESSGTTKDMADIMENTFGGAVRELIAAFEELQLGIWDLGKGTFTDLIKFVTDIIRWFSELSDTTKQWIMVIGLVVAVVGPILIVLGGLISILPALVAGIKLLGIAFGFISWPVVAVIAAIAALIAIGVALYKNWDTVKEKLSNILDVIVDKLWEWRDNFVEMIYSVVDYFKELHQKMLEIQGKINEFFISAWNSIVDFIVTLFHDFIESWRVMLTWLVDLFKANTEVLKDVANNVFTWIVGFIRDSFERIKEVFVNVLGYIKGLYNTVLDWLSSKTDGSFGVIFDSIKKYMEMSKENIKIIWDFVKTTFNNTLNFLKALVKGDFSGMKDAISAQMGNIRDTIGKIWDNVKSTVSSILSNIVSAVKNKIKEKVNGVKDNVGKVKSFIEDAWNNALSFLRGIDLSSIGADIIRGLIGGIQSKFGDLTSAISNVASNISSGIKGALRIKSPSRLMMEYGGFVTEGLSVGMDKTRSLLDRAVDRVVGTVVGGVDVIKDINVTPIDFDTDYNRKRYTKVVDKGEGSKQRIVDSGGNGEVKITIEKMEVRNDEDIVKISRELQRLLRKRKLAVGG